MNFKNQNRILIIALVFICIVILILAGVLVGGLFNTEEQLETDMDQIENR